jgi:hypothetical protein
MNILHARECSRSIAAGAGNVGSTQVQHSSRHNEPCVYNLTRAGGCSCVAVARIANSFANLLRTREDLSEVMANPLAALGRALVGGAVDSKGPAQDIFEAIKRDDPAACSRFIANGIDVNAPGPVRPLLW